MSPDFPVPRFPRFPKNSELPGFPGTEPKGKINGRDTWADKKNWYQWDYQHGKVEKYRKSDGAHVGEFDPVTGEQTKGANPTRVFKP